MASLIPPLEAKRRTSDLLGSGAVLVVTAVLGYAATVIMGVLLFASNGGGSTRSWAMLLTWQLPLAVWIATVVAVVALAALRRSAFRVSLISAGVIAVLVAAGLVIAALPR